MEQPKSVCCTSGDGSCYLKRLRNTGRTVFFSKCTRAVQKYLVFFPTEVHEILKECWDRSKKAPMELINEVPPIQVEGRIFACEGDNNPALGYPIEFICLDLEQPVIRKYCGLRYVQDHHY